MSGLATSLQITSSAGWKCCHTLSSGILCWHTYSTQTCHHRSLFQVAGDQPGLGSYLSILRTLPIPKKEKTRKEKSHEILMRKSNYCCRRKGMNDYKPAHKGWSFVEETETEREGEVERERVWPITSVILFSIIYYLYILRHRFKCWS